MAYGLKYDLWCKSRLDNLYKLKLSFDGYAGAEIERDMPKPSFFLNKDKADTIRGTSLQFSIREEVDFELLEFYTNNAKYIKAQLYLGSTLLWAGFVAPQQYQAKYKPAPCDATFTALDGLGLLKNEDFTLTGSQDQLAIIRHCMDKIGLDLGYSIAIDLYETNHNETYSPLAQTYEDGSLYANDNCYEVLEKILGKYNAEISQCGGRWRIVCDNDKKSTPKLYTYAGVYESAGSAITTLALGYPGSGIDVSPVGILQMGMQPGAKKVKITHDFGRKDSWLTNYDFTVYASDMFTGWSKNGSYDVLQREHEGKKYAFISGYSNLTSDYIHQSISVVNTDADDFAFEIDVAPIGNLSHGYSSKSSIQMTVKMLIRLYDGASTYYYLGTEGWETSETYLELDLPSSILRPIWNKISITTAALPCSGTLLVRLYRFQAASEPENTTYSGIAYSTVKTYSLSDAQLLPGILETTALFDNSSEPGTLPDINVFIADAPDYDNVGLIYKYITKLSDGSPTGPFTWYRAGSEDEYSLIVQLARMLASNNRVARQKLTGTIKGSSLAFNSIIKHDYNNNREFEIAEGTWDLYEEKWTGTLLEVLSWSDEDITFTTESSQGSSSSGGSSSIVTGIGAGNVPEIAGSEILLKLLDVDGPGSLLDADKLDGHDSSYFQEYDINLDGISALAWSSGSPFVKMTAPGTFALSSTSYQPLDADLTAIAALGFTATAFLKKTAANTWALDTNTYAPTATGGSTGDMLKQTAGGGFISAGFSYDEVSLDGHEHSASDITSGTLSNSRLDADLASIAGLGFTALSFLKKTAANTWALDTTAYQEYDINLAGIAALTWSSGSPFVKMTAPGTFALSSTSYQPLDADLTAIAALGFTATSFLKKTAANTWALDTNTYAPTATGGSTGDMLKQTAGGGFISAGFSYSEVSLSGHEHAILHYSSSARITATSTGATLTGNLVIGNGNTIGQTAGPLMTFDDTNNYLEITGAAVIIGGTAAVNDRILTVLDSGGFSGIYTDGSLQFDQLGRIFMGSTDDTGARLCFYQNADHSYIDYYEDLYFRSGVASSVNKIIFKTTGSAGFGTTAPNAKIESLATTEQLRLSYDASHYTAFTVASSGALNINSPAALTLQYGGSTKLTTSSTGVSITGVATATSYATANWTIAESGTALQFKRGASLYLELNSSGATNKVLQGDGSWIDKGQVFTAFQTLTYAASKTWDIDNGYNAKITLTGDCSLTITNADNGTSGCLIVIQDASGGHTLSFASPTYNKVIDGGLLTLDESANAINMMTFVSDGTNLYWSYGNNYLSPS